MESTPKRRNTTALARPVTVSWGFFLVRVREAYTEAIRSAIIGVFPQSDPNQAGEGKL
jgi:hypothetical protein